MTQDLLRKHKGNRNRMAGSRSQYTSHQLQGNERKYAQKYIYETNNTGEQQPPATQLGEQGIKLTHGCVPQHE